jgi:hypothetical protein
MKWCIEEINILKKYYPILNIKKLILLLPNRSIASIMMKASGLKIKKEIISSSESRIHNRWEVTEIELLKRIYDNNNDKLSSYFPKRTIRSILGKCHGLGLKRSIEIKDKKHENYKYTLNRKHVVWSDKDIKRLIDINNEKTNNELAEIFNVGTSTILSLQLKLNLKKDSTTRSRALTKRNKKMGRDLSFDNLKTIASKFNSRGEFQFHDSSAYSSARQNGWLEEICSHMYPHKYSIPQLICKLLFDQIFELDGDYNTRKIIKPYELDIYYKEYNLAIEYNGKAWHKDDSKDIQKKNICEQNGITLITIVEHNRKYEEDIKNQVLENLDLIKKITGKDITKEFILSLKCEYSHLIFNVEDIKSICSKYDNYTLWKKENMTLYVRLCKAKRLDEFTGHLKRDIVYWTKEKIEIEFKKYETLKDFYEKSKGCYIYCRRNKINIPFLPKRRNSSNLIR